MFALRIIEEERENKNAPFQQVIENFELGSSYSKIKKGSTKEFDKLIKEKFPDTDKNGIESLICAENGHTFFIEDNTENKVYSYFIMTESGKTFERL